MKEKLNVFLLFMQLFGLLILVISFTPHQPEEIFNIVIGVTGVMGLLRVVVFYKNKKESKEEKLIYITISLVMILTALLKGEFF